MGLDYWYLPILRIKYPAIKLNHQRRVNMVFPYWRVGNTTHMMVGAHACGICRVSYTSSESKSDDEITDYRSSKQIPQILFWIVSTNHQNFNYQKKDED